MDGVDLEHQCLIFVVTVHYFGILHIIHSFKFIHNKSRYVSISTSLYTTFLIHILPYSCGWGPNTHRFSSSPQREKPTYKLPVREHVLLEVHTNASQREALGLFDCDGEGHTRMGSWHLRVEAVQLLVQLGMADGDLLAHTGAVEHPRPGRVLQKLGDHHLGALGDVSKGNDGHPHLEPDHVGRESCMASRNVPRWRLSKSNSTTCGSYPSLNKSTSLVVHSLDFYDGRHRLA